MSAPCADRVRLNGPYLDFGRHWHRVRTTLYPSNGILDVGQLPYPIAGHQISIESPVFDRA
jgi:hypothetical protein